MLPLGLPSKTHPPVDEKPRGGNVVLGAVSWCLPPPTYAAIDLAACASE